MIPINFKPLTPEYMKIMDHACIEVIIRPHKVDLQNIVTIFPIFQAGRQSLFIIYWPISLNTVEKQTFLALTMLKVLDFVHF